MLRHQSNELYRMFAPLVLSSVQWFWLCFHGTIDFTFYLLSSTNLPRLFNMSSNLRMVLHIFFPCSLYPCPIHTSTRLLVYDVLTFPLRRYTTISHHRVVPWFMPGRSILGSLAIRGLVVLLTGLLCEGGKIGAAPRLTTVRTRVPLPRMCAGGRVPFVWDITLFKGLPWNQRREGTCTVAAVAAPGLRKKISRRSFFKKPLVGSVEVPAMYINAQIKSPHCTGKGYYFQLHSIQLPY